MRELEHARAEQRMIVAELRQVRGSTGGAHGPAAERYYNTVAPFPRFAFSTKGGNVLHRGACGNVDTNRCVTYEYDTHR